MSFSCSPSLTLLIQKPTKDAISIKAQLNFWRIDCTLWKGILDRNWDTYPKTLGWEHCTVCITASVYNHSGHTEKIAMPISVKTVSATEGAVYFFPHRHTKKQCKKSLLTFFEKILEWRESFDAVRKGGLMVPSSGVHGHTGPVGSTRTPLGKASQALLPSPSTSGDINPLQFSCAYRSIKYLRDKLSVRTRQSVQLFICWMVIFIANQNPGSAIFSSNHKGSSQECPPIYLFARMKEFLQRIVSKFCVQDDICGSFCCFWGFFKWLLSSMAKEQVLPGSDYSSSWEKTGFCCWGLWCSLKKAALIQCPSSPLSTGTWGPRPCSHWLLSPHWQGQSLVNDWFKLIFLYAWDYNRSSETTHFPSSKIPSRDTID